MISAYLQNKMDDTQSWFYRGEGNDTLVVGLLGNNLVLRLKKKARQTMNGDVGTGYSNYLQRIHKSLDYNKNVLLPLMGGRYVRIGDVVRLSADFADKIAKLCEPSRPKHRLHKGIDTQAPFAVLMLDLCFLPDDIPWAAHVGDIFGIPRDVGGSPSSTFSVEIKPKCGFLPSSPHIKDTHSVKHAVCYYCMLQGLKVTEGKYSRKSRYCPVNLLSGDPKRVFYALHTLVSDPQNNLRIFKDGFPIFTEEIVQEAMTDTSKDVCCPVFVLEEALKDSGWKGHTDKGSDHKCDLTLGPYSKKFMQTVLQILIDDSKSNEQYNNRIGTVSKPADICKANGTIRSYDESESLQNIGSFGCGGVLNQLRHVQKMDDSDIEALYPLYFKVKDFFDANNDAREEYSVDGPYNADIWKQVVTNPGSDMLRDKPLELWAIKDIIFKLCQFSVASTAKDCSIMLTFQAQSTPPIHLPYIEVDNGCVGDTKESIVYNIDLVDLDPKEFDRVQKYFRDNCRTVQHYLENNHMEKFINQ